MRKTKTSAGRSAAVEASVREGIRVLDIEARAVLDLKARLDERFARAVTLLFECQGKVVISGMGKSGLIGQKIAATLASTGSPSFFLHPPEGVHGDLGMLAPLLKLKPLLDAEARVIGHVPGKGRLSGMLGALRVETPAGVRFELGSGLSDAERRDPTPLGALVTYQYRSLSRDGVHRFAS